MAHTQQVARRIDNRELVHPPRLVDGSREPGNATQRQLQRRELSVEPAGIGHTPIARRLVRPGGQAAFEEEVHHQVAAGDDLVIPRRLPVPPGLESEPPIELARLFEISRRQNGFRSVRSHRRSPWRSADRLIAGAVTSAAGRTHPSGSVTDRRPTRSANARRFPTSDPQDGDRWPGTIRRWPRGQPRGCDRDRSA